MTQRILLAVDGSDHAAAAARHVLTLSAAGLRVELIVLNVQTPLSGDITAFVDAGNIADYHREQSEKATDETRQILDAGGADYRLEFAVGPTAATIAERAAELGATQIVMGSSGLGAVGSWILGSAAGKVVHLSALPVTLVR